MSLLSRFLDRLGHSEFYIHHTGFGEWLMLTLLNKRNSERSIPVALHEDSAKKKKFCDINAGYNLVYADLPVDRGIEKERFVALAFEHHNLMRRNRVGLFLAPGKDNQHVHARLTANSWSDGAQGETLFEGEVVIATDSSEDPFVIHSRSA